MKLTANWKTVIIICALAFAQTALAVKPKDEEEKECKKPKFREFAPADKAEVAPESEVAFHISRGAEANSITATARGEKIDLTVRDRINFLTAVGKLPAHLRDGYARIHITAKAAEGGCMGQDGWLIKIIEPAAKTEPTEAK